MQHVMLYQFEMQQLHNVYLHQNSMPFKDVHVCIRSVFSCWNISGFSQGYTDFLFSILCTCLLVINIIFTNYFHDVEHLI